MSTPDLHDTSLPLSEATSKTKRPRTPTVNPRPVIERFAIPVSEAASLLSVSSRTAKRLAADEPQLTCQIGRRRLFILKKLLNWVENGKH